MLLSSYVYAQSDQTVANGTATQTINFNSSSSCPYNWINSDPSIGLPASGTGNISSFIAINQGSKPITATITATPAAQGYAYIANGGDGTISVINVATNTVVSKITPPQDPFSVCISPDGTSAYIGCGGGSASVAIINTSTNTVTSTIPVNATGEATGIAISPDGNTLYVENYLTATISVVNIATKTVSAVIPVESYPYGIAVSQDGSKVYVSYTFNNYISVINTVTNTSDANISVGSSPFVTASPDGKIYVTVSSQSKLLTIDQTTNTIKTTIPTGPGPNVMAVTPDGSTAYVVLSDSKVSVINTVTGSQVATVTVGIAPNGISISPDAKFVYVVNSSSSTVSVISTATNTVIATVNVGITPVSVGNFVTAGAGCAIAPMKITITVKPSTSIAVSNATGSINSCSGAASVAPYVQKFTVSGKNLTKDIIATAPDGFELSLSNAGGYDKNLTLAESDGVVSNTIVYVRSAAAAAVGSISGQVILSSEGATNQSVLVNGTVNAISIVNQVPSQTLTAGDASAPVNFTGTAATYSWTNTLPDIGIAANGIGNIASFTTKNNTRNPITVTITVTPFNSAGCIGTPIVFTITVNPIPILQTPKIVAPNTFTPNSDGVNDIWILKNSEYYPALTVNIFDRWGKKVYTSTGYATPWDGKYEGTPLSVGTYYYVIDPKNGQSNIAGWLTIIK